MTVRQKRDPIETAPADAAAFSSVTFPSVMGHVYRFDGFRSAIAQIERCFDGQRQGSPVGDIVLSGPRGVGMTTLVNHISQFSGMGQGSVRWWNDSRPERAAHPSTETTFDWIVRETNVSLGNRSPDGSGSTVILSPSRPSPFPRSNARAHLIAVEPMTFEDTMGYVNWCRRMGFVRRPIDPVVLKRIQHRTGGHIARVTEHLRRLRGPSATPRNHTVHRAA